MEKAKIIRVWGKADGFEIEFRPLKGDIWTCQVPPDTGDGQYAVEIHAVNEFGERAYWTGILYMCGGVCHLEIDSRPFSFWISVSAVELQVACPGELKLSFEPPEFDFNEQNYKIRIKKGCCHV